MHWKKNFYTRIQTRRTNNIVQLYHWRTKTLRDPRYEAGNSEAYPANRLQTLSIRGLDQDIKNSLQKSSNAAISYEVTNSILPEGFIIVVKLGSRSRSISPNDETSILSNIDIVVYKLAVTKPFVEACSTNRPLWVLINIIVWLNLYQPGVLSNHSVAWTKWQLEKTKPSARAVKTLRVGWQYFLIALKLIYFFLPMQTIDDLNEPHPQTPQTKIVYLITQKKHVRTIAF